MSPDPDRPGLGAVPARATHLRPLGPRTLEELQSSLDAAEIELTLEQVAWRNLRTRQDPECSWRRWWGRAWRSPQSRGLPGKKRRPGRFRRLRLRRAAGRTAAPCSCCTASAPQALSGRPWRDASCRFPSRSQLPICRDTAGATAPHQATPAGVAGAAGVAGVAGAAGVAGVAGIPLRRWRTR